MTAADRWLSEADTRAYLESLGEPDDALIAAIGEDDEQYAKDRETMRKDWIRGLQRDIDEADRREMEAW